MLYIIGYTQQEKVFVKIGVSKNPSKRIKQLQTGCPNQLYLFSVFSSIHNYFSIEAQIHQHLSDVRILNEWFEFSSMEDFNESIHRITTLYCLVSDSSFSFVSKKRRQMIPPQVALKHTQWHSELLKVRDPKITDLILAIHEYVQEQKMHKDLNHGGNSYNKYTTNWNVLPLNKKWIGLYNMYPNLKDRRHQVNYFNKAIKLLIQADVLTPYDEIKGYMINPLYLCANSNCYVNMYTKWCSLTNTIPNDIYLENSFYTFNGYKKQHQDISKKEINVFIQQNNYFVL